MSIFSIIKDEIANDPLGRGYAGMTSQEISVSLSSKNILQYQPISSAELLAWSAQSGRMLNLSATASNTGIALPYRNICQVALSMLNRSETELDLNKPDRISLVNALSGIGVISPGDVTTLYDLASYYISRASQLGIQEPHAGDVDHATKIS